MVTRNTRTRRSAYSWRYVLPATGAPIGGGLMKIGHASAWAAISVGLAPFVILVVIYVFFAIGYLPAVICFLCSGRDRQDAIVRLITASTNAMVALLTFTPMDVSSSPTPQADRPELKVLKGGSVEASGQDA
jgi:hypothetical protein